MVALLCVATVLAFATLAGVLAAPSYLALVVYVGAVLCWMRIAWATLGDL